MRNNNQAIVRKLSKRSFMTNKSRNMFAITAILLTTVLITAVFTIGINLMDGMKQMMIQSSGRSTEVDFQYLTQDETERVTAHPLIKEYGLSKLVASTSEGIFRQKPGEIHTADVNFAKFTFSRPTTGRLPEADNEVALTSWILDAMGLPRELGQPVHLDFTIGDTPYSIDFIVCGFWDSDINLHPYGIAYISVPLADKLLLGVDVEHSRASGDYSGATKVSANINGSPADLEKNVNTIEKETNLNGAAAGVLINQAYTSTTMNTEVMAAMALVIIIILVSGYLLIYNIFYISVIKDIKFYGLLKTIGTTQKQLIRIVNFQALLLSVIGIPVGLLSGYLLGIGLIPVLLSFLSIEYMSAPPNPWIFLLAAALALITVLISCHGPAKTAGKISPVEAVRYTGVAAGPKKKTKRGTSGAKVVRMAYSNLFRHKKKASLVIASISIGLILFNMVYTLVGSFDVNKFLQTYICGDFLIADTDYFNMAKAYSPSYTLTEETLSKIKTLDGVEQIAKVYYEYGFDQIEGALADRMMDNFYRGEIVKENPTLSEMEIEKIIEKIKANMYGNFIPSQIYGFDDYWLDKLEENIVGGIFDREKFLSGDYIVIGSDPQNLFEVGDEVDFNIGADDGENRRYEVMAKVDDRQLSSLGAHFSSMPGYSAYLPSSEFMSLDRPNIMSATVMADDASLERLQAQIGVLLSDNPDVDFRSRADYIAEMKNDNQKLALIGFTLCAVILLIGILNFVNTTMTNIFSRKQELAILQSIGMTNQQSKKLLVLEGIYYVAAALLIFTTLGYALSYLAVMSIVEGSAAYTYQFSFVPLLISFPVLLLLAYALPTAIYNNISRDSVVQRLREIE